jgi:hypothetical protein
MAITPTYSMQSPQHEMHMRRDFSTRQRRYTYAGNLLGRTIDENFDDQLQQEEQLQFDSRENSVSDLQQRKLSVGNISQEDTEVKFILGSAVQTDERMIRTSPEIFIFPDSKELSKWKQNPVLQASGGSVLLQASEILGKVNLEPSLLDKTFICIEPFRPSRPGGLQLNLGDYVQGFILFYVYSFIRTNRNDLHHRTPMHGSYFTFIPFNRFLYFRIKSLYNTDM